MRALCAASAAGLLLLSPAAHARQSAPLTVNVSFASDGTVTAALPDGTPFGTTSGSPTVIPAGYYTLLLTGPGGCTELPLFTLRGPGEDIQTDMSGGEVTAEQHIADFQPNSTYTWSANNSSPAILHTFVTTSQVVGTAPTKSSGTSGSGGPSSQDIVGSEIVPFRGVLTSTLSASGHLMITYKGSRAARLKAGRYTVVVNDRSRARGFTLKPPGRSATTLTSAAFVGKRSKSLDLTAGRWLAMLSPGGRASAIAVS
jgi:hypothetical protein